MRMTLAEKNLIELHNAWSLARDPWDIVWLRHWTRLAKMAGLPCYHNGIDLITWDEWLDKSIAEAHQHLGEPSLRVE